MARAPRLSRKDFVVVDHMQHAWERALREGTDPYLAVDLEERILDLVAGCDPTPSGRYLTWLSRWRRAEWDKRGLGFPPHKSELSRLAEGLLHFDEIRRFLPTDFRDVNYYRTSDELLDAFVLVPKSGKQELRRQQKRLALADSEILFDQAGWTLVRLRSRHAAQWWGMGTRWCTAAQFDNKFDSYARNGALLVLLTPHDRFQLSRGTGEFRDATDALASLAQALAGSPKLLRDLLQVSN